MTQKYSKNTVNFREAVKLFSDRYNNQILNLLLRNFNISQVAKLIKLFSGEKIRIPDEKKIWQMYRNKRIRDELDTIDPTDKKSLKEKKEELAAFFCVLPERIYAIHHEEKNRYPGNFDNLNRRAHEIYREEFLNFQKSVEEVLGTEPLLKNSNKRHPIIPY